MLTETKWKMIDILKLKIEMYDPLKTYVSGDRVIFLNKIWISLIDENTFLPYTGTILDVDIKKAYPEKDMAKAWKRL